MAKKRGLKLSQKSTKVWLSAAGQVSQRKIRNLSLLSAIELVRANLRPIRELWKTFNEERHHITSYLQNSHKEASAYLLGFQRANQARVQEVFFRSQILSHLKGGDEPVKVVDLGCGTGAMSLGFLDSLAIEDSRLEFHLVDKRRQLSALAEKQLTDLGLKSEQIVLRNQDLRQWFTMEKSDFEGPQIILSGYLLNEIFADKEVSQLLKKFTKDWAGTKHPSAFVMVDSAHQNLGRLLLQWRDHMQELGWTPVYPCPTGQIHCPLLEKDKDWCFSEMDWHQEAFDRVVDEGLTLDRQTLSFSAFVFLNPAWLKKYQPRKRETVIIGRPLLMKK